MGVTNKKKTNPIIIGEINFPSKIPNLNHNKLKGVRIEEFKKPKTKKIQDIIKDHILTFSP